MAKVIAHGESRAQAISRLIAALQDLHILGVKTNISYLLDVLQHPQFAKGEFDTGWLGREFAEWAPQTDVPQEVGSIASHAGTASSSTNGEAAESPSTWAIPDGFRVAKI